MHSYVTELFVTKAVDTGRLPKSKGRQDSFVERNQSIWKGIEKTLHLAQEDPKPQLVEDLRVPYSSVTACATYSFPGTCFWPLSRGGHQVTEAFGLICDGRS